MSEEKKTKEVDLPRALNLTDEELDAISGGISEQLRRDFFSDESAYPTDRRGGKRCMRVGPKNWQVSSGPRVCVVEIAGQMVNFPAMKNALKSSSPAASSVQPANAAR
jgi:hypothetical protein